MFIRFAVIIGTIHVGAVFIAKKIDEKTKRKYIKSRLFPPIEFYKEYSPIAYKYRILIPFVWTKRLIVTLFSHGKEIKHEYDVVKKMK